MSARAATAMIQLADSLPRPEGTEHGFSKIIAVLHSPEWWFSIVVIAIIVGILSAYAKSATDKVLKRFADAVRARQAAQDRADASAAEFLASEFEVRQEVMLAAAILTVVGIQALMAALVVIALTVVIAPQPFALTILQNCAMYGAVAFFFYVAWLSGRYSARFHRRIDEARKKVARGDG